MTINEVLDHVGSDNIQFQLLAETVVKAEGKNLLTFRTSAKMYQSTMRESLGVDSEYKGIVVWLPKDKLPENIR